MTPYTISPSCRSPKSSKSRRCLIISRLTSMSLILLAAVSLFTSCTVKQDIFIQTNASGDAMIEVVVEDFFKAVIADYAVFFPEGETDVTQDNLDAVSIELNKSPYTSNAVMRKIDDSTYLGSFDFTDLDGFFRDLKNEDSSKTVVTYTQEDGFHTIDLYIDIENYYQLTEMLPILAEPSFAIFGPEENVGVSETDYRDMISYVLGEEGPGSLSNSSIDIIIETDRPIVTQQGGTLLSPSRILFSVPMVDFLLLAEPISKSVTW